MRFYHGSPKKSKVLKPYLSRGINEFQNQKAIFFTKDFTQAALYAVSKHLKGKTPFALPPGKIIIVDKFPLSKGYVYEVELKEENVKKGQFGDYEFAYVRPIKRFKIHKIKPEDYNSRVIYVNSTEEMFQILKEKLKLRK